MDQLQLQKLTFLAHGWHLGLSGRPLINQPVLAWPYGPVIRTIYDEFKRFGNGTVEGRARYYDRLEGWCDFHAVMDDYSKEVVDAVWQNYGDMTGGQLVTLTHQPGTPWEKVARGIRPDHVRDVPIPDDFIRDYYRSLALKNQEQHVEEVAL